MTQSTCTIDSCNNYVTARGWCHKHYQRWRRHGDANTVKRENYESPSEAFIARTETHGECLVWVGSKNPDGYGLIWVQGRYMTAHRYAWEKANGECRSQSELDHICHNRACVNVEHLRLASREQNMQNLSGAQSNNHSTGIRNVYRNGDRFYVRIRKDGVAHHFGTYDDITIATNVANRARVDLFEEFAGNG